MCKCGEEGCRCECGQEECEHGECGHCGQVYCEHCNACDCPCHSEGGEEYEGYGEEGEHYEPKRVLRKAFMGLVKDKLKERLEKKYGKKLDKIADALFDHFEAKMKVKKDVEKLEEFDLEGEIRKAFETTP